MEDRLSPHSSGRPVQAVNQAYQIAGEALSRIDDIFELCRRTGARRTNGVTSRSITVEYLNEPYVVSLHDGYVNGDSKVAVLSIKEKLVILHYLLTANGTPPTGKLITFRELPEGRVYYPTFIKRSVQPLVSNFSSDTGYILRLAERYGGISSELGDASFVIKALHHVPLSFVLWRGDEEFEARGNILFDSGITNYLPTEDITVLCEAISWKLIRLKSTK